MEPATLLHGARVRLSALERRDLAQLARWSDRGEYLRLYQADPAYPHTEEEYATWLDDRRKAQNAFLFAVRPAAGDELLGVLELDGIMWAHGCGWLALAIGDPEHWGQGYGREAMELALRFAFGELNLHRVQLTVFSYNARAIALYEKLGFRHEGTYREYLLRDGRRYDMLLYGMLREEWEGGAHAAVPGA